MNVIYIMKESIGEIIDRLYVISGTQKRNNQSPAKPIFIKIHWKFKTPGR